MYRERENCCCSSEIMFVNKTLKYYQPPSASWFSLRLCHGLRKNTQQYQTGVANKFRQLYATNRKSIDSRINTLLKINKNFNLKNKSAWAHICSKYAADII